MPLGWPPWIGGGDGESAGFQAGGASFMARLGADERVLIDVHCAVKGGD